MVEKSLIQGAENTGKVGSTRRHAGRLPEGVLKIKSATTAAETKPPMSCVWKRYEGLHHTPERIRRFLTAARHGSIFQNPQWHVQLGEKSQRYLVIAALHEGEPVFASLIRKTRVPGTSFFAGNAQRGPVFDNVSTAINLWDEYEAQLLECGICALGIQPFWNRIEAEQLRSFLQTRRYRLLSHGIHTETLTLDLTPPEETIFNSLSSTRRRQIRKAIRIGIEVKPAGTSEEMEKFWQLYREMCLSKGINFAPLKRFEQIRLFSKQFPADCACLLGWLNGTLVGGNIILRHSRIAEYTHGSGSIRIARGVPKTDLIHWESIRWAKRVGSTLYDFGGFKPDAEKGSHLWGINRFKLEFTQNRVELLEPMEKVFNAGPYRIYAGLKRLKRMFLKYLPIRLPA
jgi:peptidoglycan pentaglycine glycine transferase (the first glycine)